MSSAAREVVICYGCQNEWFRDEHGLECPQCHSDFVEILENDGSGTRDNDPSPTSPHPLHDHDPWRILGPNPDEENIDHVAFSPAPGIHFERTFIRSGGPRNRGNRSPNDETVGSFFQAIGGLMPGPPNPISNRPPQPTGRLFADEPQFATQNPFPHPHPPQPRMRSAFTMTGSGGGRGAWTTEGRIFPPNPQRSDPNDPMAGIQAMMQTFMGQLQNMHGTTGPNQRGERANGPATFAELLAQIMNPANAVHGDAVYSQEALDRIMNQLMEQGGGSTAPGPASESAISALPKKKVNKSMMGSDGKAECSVCMDNVEIGDEVTCLPCNHWFHEQCVGIWLKEHDTCPHCRKGIMPAEGEDNAPRTPGQLPRHNTNPFENLANHPAMPFTQPGMQHPYVPGGYPSYPEPQNYVQPTPSTGPLPHPSDQLHPPPSLSHRHHGLRRERSRASSSSSRNHGDGGNARDSNGGGVTGWIRSLRGNRNSDS